MPPANEEWKEMIVLLTTVATRQDTLIGEVAAIRKILQGNGTPGLVTRVDRLERAWNGHLQADREQSRERRQATAEWKDRLFYPLLTTALLAVAAFAWQLITHQAMIVQP